MAQVALMGCSGESPRQATGPGSETSGVSARVVDAGGVGVAGVSVRLVAVDRKWQEKMSKGDASVLDRRTTDAQGWVRFEVAGQSHVALELEDSLRCARGEVDLSGSRSAELRAAPGGRLRIAAKVGAQSVRSVALAGTGYAGAENLDGTWSFSGVASGDYAAIALTDSGMAFLGRLSVASGAALDTTMVADVDSVLLEDFAFAPIKNRYGWLLGAGWWYTTTDKIYGGASTATPGDPAGALVACPYGNCLSVAFSIDQTASERFALVGMDIDHPYDPKGPRSPLADFSKVDRVRFGASGAGEVQFQIHYRNADGTTLACHHAVVLQSAWKLQEVVLSSMVCDTGPVAGRRAVGMTWVAVADAQFNLGPVTLLGAGPRSVFPELQLGGAP
jgi:hypothetical protein